MIPRDQQRIPPKPRAEEIIGATRVGRVMHSGGLDKHCFRPNR